MKMPRNDIIKKTQGNRSHCSAIEIELPELDQEQLDPLLDFIVELLAKERSQELEQSEEERP